MPATLRSRLFTMSSATALSTALAAATAFSTPAAAALPTHPTGVFAGGSTLASQVLRQLLDCYGNHVADDGFTTATNFTSNPPSVGKLPPACSKPAVGNSDFEGLFAGTGSGRGRQALIAHDAHQLYEGSGSTTALPSSPPPFTDAASHDSYFTHYPYPSSLLSFIDSDNALPGSPSNPGTLSVTTIQGATKSYDTAAWGPAIQVPLLETPIAIPVNVNGMHLNQVQPPQGTSRLQLSEADVCAIFSGVVNNWDSTATIAGYDASGNVTTVQFDQDNNPNWRVSATPTPFALHSLPITIYVRADSSGTSAIFSNWLHAACAPLDNGTNHYAAIFHGQVTTFTDLWTQATPNPLPVPANIVAVDGSGGVAGGVGKTSATAGAIGYVSPDFTARYTKTVGAPVTASIQDKYQRLNGVVHPYSGANFITPTPASTDAGFKNATPPAAGASYTAWDLTAETTEPAAQTAYPMVGVTYLAFYTCYAKGTALLGSGANIDGSLDDRFNAIRSFLSWMYPAAQAPLLVRQVIENNGFHELSANLTAAVHAEYLVSADRIAQPGQTASCPSSAKGA